MHALLFQCCSCFGPKNGKKEYCAKECESKNNGTVHKKNVYTWFWVRSSLPKRPWSKCMDYKVKESGKIVWYKFVGDSEIPVLVSLDQVLSFYSTIYLKS